MINDTSTSKKSTETAPSEGLTQSQLYTLESEKENHRNEGLRRWDYMHISVACLVIVVVAFFIGVFAWRGDVQGMSSAAAIGSGWVGAVLGWFFTRPSSTSTAPESSKQPPGPGGSTCPKCGQPTVVGAKFCPSCGTSLAPPPQKTCPKCNASNSSTSKFCSSCGQPLP